MPAPTPSPQGRASALARLVRNGDVKWTWDAYSSVHPRLDTPAAAAVRSLGPVAVPPLLLALDDPARYVAAHVLLTEIAGPPYSADAQRYNDLRVDLDADECVEIRPDATPALLRKWHDWARAEGHAPPAAIP